LEIGGIFKGNGGAGLVSRNVHDQAVFQATFKGVTAKKTTKKWGKPGVTGHSLEQAFLGE